MNNATHWISAYVGPLVARDPRDWRGIGLALGSNAGEREQNPFLNMMLAISCPGAPDGA